MMRLRSSAGGSRSINLPGLYHGLSRSIVPESAQRGWKHNRMPHSSEASEPNTSSNSLSSIAQSAETSRRRSSGVTRIRDANPPGLLRDDRFSNCSCAAFDRYRRPTPKFAELEAAISAEGLVKQHSTVLEAGNRQLHAEGLASGSVWGAQRYTVFRQKLNSPALRERDGVAPMFRRSACVFGFVILLSALLWDVERLRELSARPRRMRICP